MRTKLTSITPLTVLWFCLSYLVFPVPHQLELATDWVANRSWNTLLRPQQTDIFTPFLLIDTKIANHAGLNHVSRCYLDWFLLPASHSSLPPSEQGTNFVTRTSPVTRLASQFTDISIPFLLIAVQATNLFNNYCAPLNLALSGAFFEICRLVSFFNYTICFKFSLIASFFSNNLSYKTLLPLLFSRWSGFTFQSQMFVFLCIAVRLLSQIDQRLSYTHIRCS